MPDYTINRRHFIGSSLTVAATAVASRALAATGFVVADRPVIALSDGYFDMPSDMFLGTPQSLRDQLGNPARIAANTLRTAAASAPFCLMQEPAQTTSLRSLFQRSANCPKT